MAVAKRASVPARPSGALLSGWRLYGLLIAVGAIVYVMTDDPNAGATATRKPVKRTRTATEASRFKPEDYTASFAAAPMTRDAFRPAVVRQKAASAPKAPRLVVPPVKKVDDGVIPNALLGEPNSAGKWVYSGVAELNSQRMGLLENQTTGEGEFVQAGDAFKATTIVTIRPEWIVLRDAAGALRTIKVTDTDAQTATPPVAGTSGQGVTPSTLRGPIGSVDVQPLPAITSAEAEVTRQPEGRRGRRNRNRNADAN